MRDIEELGEESGREEAACDFPVIDEEMSYRDLRAFGRARAQGLYELRGREARKFAQCWATGYQSTASILSDDLESAWSPEGRHYYGLQEEF